MLLAKELFEFSAISYGTMSDLDWSALAQFGTPPGDDQDNLLVSIPFDNEGIFLRS